MRYKSLLENKSSVRKLNKPWTTLQVFDIASTRAHIKAQNRKGPMKIKLVGAVPKDLVICISEHYPDATEHNATWVIKHPLYYGFTLKPEDLRFLGA